MIGILFIYWIWKAFTNLAIEYDKNKWTYFFIGIGSYYGGTIVAGFVAGLLSVLINGFNNIAEDDAIMSPGWNLVFVLFGGLACYGIHKYLEKKLEKERALYRKEGIESIGLNEEN